MSQMPLLDALLRHRYLIIGLLGLAMFVGSIGHLTGDSDWQFFSWGSDLLFGQHYLFVRSSYTVTPTLPGGLHIYGNYPFLQIGPPPLLIAKALDVGPRHGIYIAGAAVQALSLAFVLFADRAFYRNRSRAGRLSVLVGGALLTVVWGSLTHYRHLDDAMALTALAGATWALTRNRPVTAGCLLGLAAASKPWAVAVLALVLVPPTWRERRSAALAGAAVVLLFWLPFVVADPETLRLGDVTLQLSTSSALRALGIDHLSSGEPLRLAQFGIGLGLAAFIVARQAWPLAPLAAFAARLALEPSTYPYYASAVVAAALLADLGTLRWAAPGLTIVASAGWIAGEATSSGTAAWIRLLLYVGLTVAALAIACRPSRRPARLDDPCAAS